MKEKLLTLVLLLSVFACTNLSTNNKKEAKKPLNVILLIGDGMGLSQVSSAYYFKKEGEVNFSRFTKIGLINTSAADEKITDSAAAGTAYSCGERTRKKMIGMSVDTVALQNITDSLSSLNYSTGIVVTSPVTDATPAAFYGHVASRYQYEDLASQLATSEIDFVAGGGLRNFVNRQDGTNQLKVMEENGFVIDTVSLGAFDSNPEKKYAFLLAPGDMPKMPEGRGNYLPTATQMAIDYLSQNADGFFLMVESSQIDWGGHRNNAEHLITEVIDFDTTVGRALDFAQKDGNTLVIVTADHETGGFALSGDKYENIKFATTQHTATMVPVFAYGPQAELFTGIFKNNEIYHKIIQAILSNE